ncbi:MAG: DNA polymerase III subunit beta [Patescibacteria group bacterium]
MKFTCLQENLSRALTTVSKAVSNKGPMPVLSNVLLSTEGGRLKLSATNLETSITTWIGASVEEEGSVTIPARLLSEFISNLPPQTVSGESDDFSLKIMCDKASSKFNGLDASEFPSLPDTPDEVHLTMDPKIFSEVVSEVAFAAAMDEGRPVLTGILVYSEGGKLFMVGVDGFRLAERVVELAENETVKENFSAIIPAKIILEVARLVSSLKEPLEISLNKDGNLAVFKSSDLLISSRLLDGAFPEYKKLIPDPALTNIRVEMLTKDFTNGLRLANVFAKENATSVVKFKVSGEDGVLYISSSSTEAGENRSSVDAKIDGGDIEVAFNSKYILDALSNIKADGFVFSCSDKIGPGMPGVLKPVGRDNHTYLIMPLQY